MSAIPLDGADLAPTHAPAAPMRVLTGNPTDAELAAVHSVIVAMLAEQAARGAELLTPPVDRWHTGTRAMRGPIFAGAGAWRASNGMRGC